MSAHDHRTYVDGCYRCELSRDEADQTTTPAEPEGPQWEWTDFADTDPRIVAMHRALEDGNQCVQDGLWCEQCAKDAKRALAALLNMGVRPLPDEEQRREVEQLRALLLDNADSLRREGFTFAPQWTSRIADLLAAAFLTEGPTPEPEPESTELVPVIEPDECVVCLDDAGIHVDANDMCPDHRAEFEAWQAARGLTEGPQG